MMSTSPEPVRCGAVAPAVMPAGGAGDFERTLPNSVQAEPGHDNLQGFCRGLLHSLRPAVDFDYVGLVLYGRQQGVLWLHALAGLGQEYSVAAAPDADNPAAWVWRHQQPLAISDSAHEGRWPEFILRLRSLHIGSLTLLPLNDSNRRWGVLSFGRCDVYAPGDTELAFLQRSAAESAVALSAHLVEQDLRQERDRLKALFEITNIFMSKRTPEQLFSSIAEELRKVIEYDVAAVTLYNKQSGNLQLQALHCVGSTCFEVPRDPVPPDGLPAGEALRTGKAVVTSEPSLERFPSAMYRKWVDAGLRGSCSVPLVAPNGVIGTLELARLRDRNFTPDEVDLCLQVARQVGIAIENLLAYRELATMRDKLATEKLYLEDEIRIDQNPTNMVGESPAFQALVKSAQVVAPTDATVLILGETGTGKELVARAVHDMSGRSKRSFVKVNCAAIPAALLESELFGHEKGAFTGAVATKIGRFELADHGTLFLDEVGEIPLELQSKLLRAIQEQEFERVGSNKTIRADIRVVAATNRDLRAMMEEGKFRSDLYYRLHVFPLEVPPLRDRRPDVPLLIRYFTQEYSRRMNRHIESISTASMEALTAYSWPGNIRELQNLVERSVILAEGEVLRLAVPDRRNVSDCPHDGCASLERAKILRALRDSQGIVGGAHGAAARLGMKRTTLQSHMKRLEIDRRYQ
jgi:formate hydrogenlyase transcriptional activator